MAVDTGDTVKRAVIYNVVRAVVQAIARAIR